MCVCVYIYIYSIVSKMKNHTTIIKYEYTQRNIIHRCLHVFNYFGINSIYMILSPLIKICGFVTAWDTREYLSISLNSNYIQYLLTLAKIWWKQKYISLDQRTARTLFLTITIGLLLLEEIMKFLTNLPIYIRRMWLRHFKRDKE